MGSQIDFKKSPYNRILYNGYSYTDTMDEAGRDTILNVAKALLPLADELEPWENAYIQIRENGTFAVDDGFPPQLMVRIMELIH